MWSSVQTAPPSRWLSLDNDISESNCCLRVDDGLAFLGGNFFVWMVWNRYLQWVEQILLWWLVTRVVGNEKVRLNRRNLDAGALCHVGRFRRQAGLVYYRARWDILKSPHGYLKKILLGVFPERSRYTIQQLSYPTTSSQWNYFDGNFYLYTKACYIFLQVHTYLCVTIVLVIFMFNIRDGRNRRIHSWIPSWSIYSDCCT